MRSSSLRRRKQHIKNPAKGRIPMKHLVEFPLEEGGSIVVEVDEPETSGTASLGAVIASATAEANFDITLRWTGNTKEKAP